MKNYYTKIAILILVCFNNIYSQDVLSSVVHKKINEHISYVNNCIDYTNAIYYSLEKFNSNINKSIYYRTGAFHKTKLEPLQILHHGNYNRFSLEQIHKQYQDIISLEGLNNQKLKEEILTATNSFQAVFEELNTKVASLIKFANKTDTVSSKKQLNIFYKQLFSIEAQIALLTEESYHFSDEITRLYGAEKLPQILERTKKIVFLSKKLIRNLRAENKTALRKVITEIELEISKRKTGEEHKALENFGDYGSIEDDHGIERVHIKQRIVEHIKDVKQYLDEDKNPVSKLCYNNYDTLGEGTCQLFKVLVSYETDSNPSEIYNKKQIIRADIPVLHIVKEIQIFRVFIPEKFTVSELSEEKVNDTKKIENSILNMTDITSLEGAKINNLVLLLDISGSMKINDNDAKLKKSIKHLIDLLRKEDKLTIVSYSGKPKVVLNAKVNYDKETLKKTITKLTTGGKTNINTALKMAYKISKSNFIDGGNNRIIIASDGDFLIKKQNETKIKSLAKKGITLSTFHFKYKDSKGKTTLTKLATFGQGNYTLITSEEDAIKAIVGESKQ